MAIFLLRFRNLSAVIVLNMLSVLSILLLESHSAMFLFIVSYNSHWLSLLFSFFIIIVFAPLGNFQELSSDMARRHSPQWVGLCLLLVPCLGKLCCAPAKLLIWGSKSGWPASSWVPCAERAPFLMSTFAGEDYYLGTADMNSASQDLRAGCCSALASSLSHSHLHWLSPADFPASPIVGDQSMGSHRLTPVMGEHWLSRLSSCFVLEEPETQGRCLRVVLCWASRGAMKLNCSCFSYSSNAICLGLWGSRGCFSLTPIF